MPIKTIVSEGCFDASVRDTINDNFALGTYTPPSGNLEVTGTLLVDGATTAAAGLTVTGAATVSTTLAVTGAASVGGNLTASGTLIAAAAATIATTLTVTGATTLSSTAHIVGAITADGAVTVTGLLKSGPTKKTLTAITANGAIDPHTSASYVFTKAGVAVMTLAAPTATTDDGIVIQLTGSTADQNTVTATGLFQDGAGHVNLATWPANIGGTLTLMAYQAKWVVIANSSVVMS